jgi:hypothetical protein
MRRTSGLLVGMLALAACESTTAAGRPTTDSRVHSLQGRAPPEFTPDARWLNAPPASLASMRGRVLFVQFAFPT